MSTNPEFTQVLHEWSEVFMRHSMHDFKRFMDSSGLSASQLNTMMRLYHTGYCEISDITSQLGVTPAASSQLIDRLVHQGFLERFEATRDRRVKRLHLTSLGRDLIEKGIDVRCRWMEQLTDELSPLEQEEIQRALVLLTQAARCLEQAFT